MSLSHVTKYFLKAKEHGVQWRQNGATASPVLQVTEPAQSNRHGNCATATVDTVVLRKFRAACISKITVEITTFLPCSL